MTSDRTQIAKIAANARWAKCDDRSAATQAARDGMTRRFELEVDPDRKLLPEERARRAESVRRAYYQRLALKSAQSRRAKKEKAMTPEQERLEVERLQNEGLVAQGLPPVDRSRPVSRRQKAIDAAGDLAAEHDIAMAAMTPREQAEAAYTPVPCYCHNVVHSIDELEDMIRADRGLPPLDRGGEADEVRRDDGA